MKSSHSQLLTILSSLYPLPGELIVSPPPSPSSASSSSTELIILNLNLSPAHDVNLQILINCKENVKVELRIKQPDWLNRKASLEFQSAFESYFSTLPNNSNDVNYDGDGDGDGDGEDAEEVVEKVLNGIEWIKEHALLLMSSQTANDLHKEKGSKEEAIEKDGEVLLRVFFWFPSLSTKEKRQDLVNFAPSYDLTGFALAGKPGILCLEGTEKGIDAYMKEIKSVSWSDIPSGHKKVTERLRLKIHKSERKFKEMEEITSLISQSGTRGNRGDMGMVKAWMMERGLSEEEFGVVTGLSS